MPLTDIRLLREPLDLAAAIAAVTCPEGGGIDAFIGITRQQHDPAHGNLAALDYHAYDEMALRQIRALVDQAATQWPILRIAVWHRVGHVAVSQPSVVIAVCCPHRAEAFDACRFIIEELKKSVPIWKQEIFASDARWQTPPA